MKFNNNFNNEHIKPSNKLKELLLIFIFKNISYKQKLQFSKIKVMKNENALLKICLAFLKLSKF